MKHFLMGTAAVLLLGPQIAVGQTQPARPANPPPQNPPQQQAQGQPVAQQCLSDLQGFGQQMQKDGLWLSGYRAGYGWPATTPASRRDQTAAHTAPGPGTIGDRSGSDQRARAADVQAQGGGAIGRPGPWAKVDWPAPPMQQLRALHNAAVVLAHRGEQQGCNLVLTELREAYGEYGQQLRQAGGDSRNMGRYRQQELGQAKPVAQMNRAFRTDSITGTDVRSPSDEYLGSAEDVIVDPNTGQVSYVILARGGFLGIGEHYVAVPWRRLQATPNMDMLVLNTTDAALEKAPRVDPEAFADSQAYGKRSEEIDRFWQQQEGGRAG